MIGVRRSIAAICTFFVLAAACGSLSTTRAVDDTVEILPGIQRLVDVTANDYGADVRLVALQQLNDDRAEAAITNGQVSVRGLASTGGDVVSVDYTITSDGVQDNGQLRITVGDPNPQDPAPVPTPTRQPSPTATTTATVTVTATPTGTATPATPTRQVVAPTPTSTPTVAVEVAEAVTVTCSILVEGEERSWFAPGDAVTVTAKSEPAVADLQFEFSGGGPSATTDGRSYALTATNAAEYSITLDWEQPDTSESGTADCGTIDLKDCAEASACVTTISCRVMSTPAGTWRVDAIWSPPETALTTTAIVSGPVSVPPKPMEGGSGTSSVILDSGEIDGVVVDWSVEGDSAEVSHSAKVNCQMPGSAEYNDAAVSPPAN